MGSPSSGHVSQQSAASPTLAPDQISQLLAQLQLGNNSPFSDFASTVNCFMSSSTHNIAWIVDTEQAII